MPDYGVYVSIGTLLSVIGASVALGMRISRIDRETREWTDALMEDIRRDIVDLERTAVNRGETFQREAGEMGHALRTKIHEIETWNRDTFVRKESFEVVINRIEKSIDKMGDKLESKIDRAVERLQSGSGN